VKLVGSEGQKLHVLHAYVDDRSKINAAILLDMGHTQGRPHMRRIGQGKETKNLKVVDVLTVQERI
jgi:hypothetical protein